MRIATTAALGVLLVSLDPASGAEPAPGSFVCLCYHDVPTAVTNDNDAVDLRSFVEQLEYLRTHGFHFVGPRDIFAAHEGKARLPDKAVLLTFDDAYRSFAENVLPVLEQYGYPAVLSVCSSWLDQGPPDDIRAPIMTWAQVQAAAGHRLVTVASHSHAQHKAILFNPQGNTAHATSTFRYCPEERRYETEPEFRRRMADDLAAARRSLSTNAQVNTEILAWPYGEYNEPAVEEATRLGFRMLLTLREDRRSAVSDLLAVNRWAPWRNPDLLEFAERVERLAADRPARDDSRGIEVDLDSIHAPSQADTERNLGALLDRVTALEASTIYLRGCSDSGGRGPATSAYFPSRVLPMRADLLGRVANQLLIRGFKVYVCMPVLRVAIPGSGPAAPGQAAAGGQLSPFAARAEEAVAQLYEDMAMHVRGAGVVFARTEYPAPGESLDPAARDAWKKAYGRNPPEPGAWTAGDKAAWNRLLAPRLDAFTGRLTQAVRRYRPLALFGQTLAPAALDDPAAPGRPLEAYVLATNRCDFVVLADGPEAVDASESWTRMEAAVSRIARLEQALARTVFTVPTFDGRRNEWIAAPTLLDRVRRLATAGARHIVCLPDNFAENRPDWATMKREMSLRTELTRRPR